MSGAAQPPDEVRWPQAEDAAETAPPAEPVENPAEQPEPAGQAVEPATAVSAEDAAQAAADVPAETTETQAGFAWPAADADNAGTSDEPAAEHQAAAEPAESTVSVDDTAETVAPQAEPASAVAGDDRQSADDRTVEPVAEADESVAGVAEPVAEAVPEPVAEPAAPRDAFPATEPDGGTAPPAAEPPADEPQAEVQPTGPLVLEPRNPEPMNLFAPAEPGRPPEDPTLPAQPLPDVGAPREESRKEPGETQPETQATQQVPREVPRDADTRRVAPVEPPKQPQGQPQNQPPSQPQNQSPNQPLAQPIPPARIEQTVRVRPAETTNYIRPIRERPEEQTAFLRPVPPAPQRPPARPPQQNQPHPNQQPPAQPRPPQPHQPPAQQQNLPPAQPTQPLNQPRPQRPPAPPRAMPMRIEPNEPVAEPAAEPEPEPEAPPRRRGRGRLVAGLGLLLVIAVVAGVLFFVPGAAKKIGLHGIGPENSTADPPSPAQVALALRAVTGKPATPGGVSAALRQVTANPALGTLTGEVLDARTGGKLWSRDAGTPLGPGSTNKLLTAAAALLTLDPQATFTTKVVAGSKPGSVVIVGGGDPTLSSLPVGEDSVYPGAAHLDQLVDRVKASGAKVSSVSVDLDRYTGDAQAQGWSKADIAAGNFTPIVPAMLDGGRNDPNGEDAPRTDNPAGDLADEFASRIGATSAGQGSAPKGAKVLGEVHSAPMADLIENMLRISDNVLAEAIGREVARRTHHAPSFDGAVTAIRETLRRNGFDLAGMQTADCSGLSTVDKIPARLLGSVLSVTARTGGDPRTAKLRTILTGLPVAGGTGTLSADHKRFQDSSASDARGYVRAKTGTLSGVSTLAGVVLDTDGRLLVFVMMSNGSSADLARPALDDIAAALHRCGSG